MGAMRSPMLWTAGVLLVACVACLALHGFVGSSGATKMLESLRADLDTGQRHDEDARRHFGREELAAAIADTDELLAWPSSAPPLDLRNLIARIKDAYENDLLSTRELRGLARELKRLRGRS